MYDNQSEIDIINDKLKNIDDSLKITHYGLDGNKATSVGISIMEKGNAKLIKELESLGWRKTIRDKVRTDSGITRNQYSGYAMRVYMNLDI